MSRGENSSLPPYVPKPWPRETGLYRRVTLELVLACQAAREAVRAQASGVHRGARLAGGLVPALVRRRPRATHVDSGMARGDRSRAIDDWLRRADAVLASVDRDHAEVDQEGDGGEHEDDVS